MDMSNYDNFTTVCDKLFQGFPCATLW